MSLQAIEPTRARGQRRVDGVESPRHRADAATETTSRPWRGAPEIRFPHRFNLLFRVGCLCAKVFLVVATPGTLAEDSFQGHAVRAGELAVAKVRSGPGCVS